MEQHWHEADGALRRTFAFADFREALSFVNKVADAAENLQHHPDICIKNYRQVFVSTTTHAEGGIVTAKDHQLALAVDDIRSQKIAAEK